MQIFFSNTLDFERIYISIQFCKLRTIIPATALHSHKFLLSNGIQITF